MSKAPGYSTTTGFAQTVTICSKSPLRGRSNSWAGQLPGTPDWADEKRPSSKPRRGRPALTTLLAISALLFFCVVLVTALHGFFRGGDEDHHLRSFSGCDIAVLSQSLPDQYVVTSYGTSGHVAVGQQAQVSCGTNRHRPAINVTCASAGGRWGKLPTLPNCPVQKASHIDCVATLGTCTNETTCYSLAISPGVNMSVPWDSRVPLGGKIEFKCARNYVIANPWEVGATEITCLPGGTWPAVVSYPVCKKVAPITGFSTPCNNLDLWWVVRHANLPDSTQMTPSGQTIKLTCKTGYAGRVSVTCNGNGNWSAATGTCRSTGCPALLGYRTIVGQDHVGDDFEDEFLPGASWAKRASICNSYPQCRAMNDRGNFKTVGGPTQPSTDVQCFYKKEGCFSGDLPNVTNTHRLFFHTPKTFFITSTVATTCRKGLISSIPGSQGPIVQCIPGEKWKIQGRCIGNDKLLINESLGVGEMRFSRNGRFGLVLQDDGNLVLYKDFDPEGGHLKDMWASATSMKPRPMSAHLDMHEDGTLALYRSSGTKQKEWERTTGKPGSYLMLQDDGDMVLLDADGNMHWSTKTKLKKPEPLPEWARAQELTPYELKVIAAAENNETIPDGVDSEEVPVTAGGKAGGTKAAETAVKTAAGTATETAADEAAVKKAVEAALLDTDDDGDSGIQGDYGVALGGGAAAKGPATAYGVAAAGVTTVSAGAAQALGAVAIDQGDDGVPLDDLKPVGGDATAASTA